MKIWLTSSDAELTTFKLFLRSETWKKYKIRADVTARTTTEACGKTIK
jgi:hypothetical protein